MENRVETHFSKNSHSLSPCGVGNCETSIDQGPATICVCTVGSLGDGMEPANQIRIALAKVTGLRTDAREDPRLDESVRWVKQFQTKRFESTYSDLIADGPYRGATRFFLDELYGEVSYAERDAQFSKIAGALQRLLPEQALATTVALAQLHSRHRS